MRDSSLRLYDDLAWTWPIISPVADYREECEQLIALLQNAGGAPVERVLHWGCGGGHHDAHLKRAFQMTGVDLHEGILEIARQTNPECTYCHGDMRRFSLEARFDAVLLLDSNMYLLSRADLHATLANSFRHLRPGGVFLTVIETTRENFIQDCVLQTFGRQGDTHVALLQHYYDPDSSDTHFDNTFFYTIHEGATWHSASELHRNGLFSEGEWYEAMASAGFEPDVIDSSALSGDLYNLYLLQGIKP